MQVNYRPCPALPPTITAPAHHYRPCPPILSLTPILFRFFNDNFSSGARRKIIYILGSNDSNSVSKRLKRLRWREKIVVHIGLLPVLVAGLHAFHPQAVVHTVLEGFPVQLVVLA